ISHFSQLILTLIAYILDLMLVFIIQRSTRKEIGPYRILLTFFVLSDLYFNTIHFIVYPIPEMYGNAFIMRGHGLYTELLGLSLYGGAYGHAFPILIFHFLYRYLAIKKPKFLQHFRFFFFALMVSTAACNALMFTAFYYFFGPDEESLRILGAVFNGSLPLPLIHAIDSAEKNAQALYWSGATFEGPRWRNIIGMGMMAATMSFAYAVIITCTVLINKYLKNQLKSSNTMRLHNQLFRALISQAFVPLFTAYYPAGTAMILPLFGITVPYISIIVPPACCTHSLFDPLVLILTITEYRRAFFKNTGLSKLQAPSKSVSSKDATHT
ncbi:hypothetical protein PMAYCL1PPCAC_15630, partial [Pristionchus mayeri]